MTPLHYLIPVLLLVLLFYVLVYALCRAAAAGDRHIDNTKGREG